jgi:phosphotriesterase-related protein
LIAAARVNKKLGVPIMVHTEPFVLLANEALKILHKNGADLNKVCICHLDLGEFNFNYCEKIIKTGAFIGFDTFGYVDQLTEIIRPPSDNCRINNLLRLLERGYIKNLLIGNDVAFKHRLRKYGGYGYNHFLENILPLLRYEGVTEKEINTLIVENPIRYLNIIARD